AFFILIRFSSLFDMCHRLRRAELRTWLFTTCLRKRRSNCSWLSPERSSTFGKRFTSFVASILQPAMLRREETCVQSNRRSLVIAAQRTTCCKLTDYATVRPCCMLFVLRSKCSANYSE